MSVFAILGSSAAWENPAGALKRALEPRISKERTNVQQLTCKMVWSFSFFLFCSLKKRPDFKRSPGAVEKCEKV